MVHRVVAGAFIPNPDNKSQVNHKDGVKVNIEVRNLEWVTAKENSKHAVETGLIHNSFKLTKADAIQVKYSNLSNAKLAKIFGVSRRLISQIKNNECWKHV